MNKKDKKHIKVLKQYLVSANDRAKYSIERFDILIITLSSGGIVLSMSFFENYKNIDKTMVYNGCLCFAFALIINLVSQVTGYFANRYDIKYVREEIRELENKLKAFQDTKGDDKRYKKKRRDIMYNLNTKGRKPREDTLTKYNITYDEDKKIFI